MSHGIQVGASYTYSHSLDEQSGVGLFYNGNNPLDLRDGFASSDFDRTHVFNFNYVYRLPEFYGKDSLKGRLTNGWSLVGLTVSAERTTLQRSRLQRGRREHLLQRV